MLHFYPQNSNTATITLSPTKPRIYKYSVKLINANRRSQYVVRKLNSTEQFSSILSLKEQLTNQFQEAIIDFGYIEPGHGLKGKQVWLVEDADVDEMYTHFKKREITLWCHIQTENDQ